MRIKVISKEDKVRINLALPNSLIKSKMIIRSIEKYGNIKLDKEIGKKMYSIIKEYIKENGHFTLVEVVSRDDTYVKIRL